MTRIIVSAVLLISLLIPGMNLWAQERPESGNDGVWVMRYDMKRIDKKFYYTVDTVAQLCFSFLRLGTGTGLTEVQCSALKKRPEWHGIIIWD